MDCTIILPFLIVAAMIKPLKIDFQLSTKWLNFVTGPKVESSATTEPIITKNERINSEMTNYVIEVNQEKTQVATSDISALDLIRTNAGDFHLLEKNRTYRIKLLHADYENKSLTVLVNENKYQIKIEDEYDIQVKEMGLLANSSQKANSVKAPMPGLIIDILVMEGQNITDGTPLVVLSAMKMENIILATGDGIIKSIKVNKEDSVEKGQLIIEFE
ncbi:acetyl-CoA carboxylase biotin carboxyl carrier protein subunit [Flavobacteriaceae bacterium F89]|uniref:Acetyl-CoA carboxylase biotin carboxyl carrier protein subunit n=1 Tax=Cerina litoralis TaxID=2874477 RepID=A0AAE3JQR6_9FLAO|nr:acetyl-CoA carboxylase biotin carboxyl carrier protein subunit [Cerina litoralis]MCG2462164.1 acetyl-CoA carboxylase biotin carboxyl carrier protein subunit [Cerina litoralis]